MQNLSEHPNMMRQRVDCRGKTREMEPEESIPCLQLPENEVCLLKEAPARLWCDQQKKWDKRFEATAKRIPRHRRNYEKKYEAAIRRALELGMIATKDEEMGKSPNSTGQETTQIKFAIDSDTNERRWNPLDLHDERPPPSAIAGRRDNVSQTRSRSSHSLKRLISPAGLPGATVESDRPTSVESS